MTITLTNLLQCDYVIIKNSGESFRNEMKSAEGVSRKQICKSLRQKDGWNELWEFLDVLTLLSHGLTESYGDFG